MERQKHLSQTARIQTNYHKTEVSVINAIWVTGESKSGKEFKEKNGFIVRQLRNVLMGKKLFHNYNR